MILFYKVYSIEKIYANVLLRTKSMINRLSNGSESLQEHSNVEENSDPSNLFGSMRKEDEWIFRVSVAITVFFLFSVLSWLAPMLFKYILFRCLHIQQIHQMSSGVHIYREVRDVCSRLSNCRAGKDLWEAGGISPSFYNSGKTDSKSLHTTVVLGKLYTPDRKFKRSQFRDLAGRPFDDLGELFSGRIRSYYVTFWSAIIGMLIFIFGVILALYILKIKIYAVFASLGMLALLATILVRDTASNFVAGLSIMKNNLIEAGDYVVVGTTYSGWVCLVKSTHTTLYTRCKTKCSDGTEVRVEFVEVPKTYFFNVPFKILTKGWELKYFFFL